MYTTRRAALAALTGFTALAALAGGLVAGPAGPASASPIDGHEIVDVSSSGGSGDSQTAVAECPTGKSLIGTGAMIGSASRAIVLTSIVPNLVTDSVEVTAHETPAGTGLNWTVEATAVCANDNEVPAMYLEDASDAPDANGHAGAAAPCDAGDVALGAGFELSARPGASTSPRCCPPWPAQGSRPPTRRPRAWRPPGTSRRTPSAPWASPRTPSSA